MNLRKKIDKTHLLDASKCDQIGGAVHFGDVGALPLPTGTGMEWGMSAQPVPKSAKMVLARECQHSGKAKIPEIPSWRRASRCIAQGE